MLCQSKYSPDQIYNCSFTEDRNVIIWKDTFKIIITKGMFEKLYKIIDETNSI